MILAGAVARASRCLLSAPCSTTSMRPLTTSAPVFLLAFAPSTRAAWLAKMKKQFPKVSPPPPPSLQKRPKKVPKTRFPGPGFRCAQYGRMVAVAEPGLASRRDGGGTYLARPSPQWIGRGGPLRREVIPQGPRKVYTFAGPGVGIACNACKSSTGQASQSRTRGHITKSNYWGSYPSPMISRRHLNGYDQRFPWAPPRAGVFFPSSTAPCCSPQGLHHLRFLLSYRP